MKRLGIAAALMVPLAACGAPVAVSPSPTIVKMSLREACPQAEAAIKGMDIVSDTPADIRAAADRVQAIVDAGDQETVNAMSRLADAIRAGESTKPGMEKIDASQRLIAALGTLADRCEAVGSSSFQ